MGPFGTGAGWGSSSSWGGLSGGLGGGFGGGFGGLPHPLTVTNLDEVSHDLQIYERDRDHVFIMFHHPALTKLGTSDTIRFTGKRRDVIMQCGMRRIMQGHRLPVENPYYAITGPEGSFEIKDLPAGTYRIKAWHPTLGEKVQDVTVAANGSTSLGFKF